MKRKSLVLIYMVLTGLLCWPVGAFSQGYSTIKAQEDLYFVGDRTFSCFYITDAGVIVIDPLDSAHAAATMSAIRQLTDKPVRYVFYSHNHWDHISGGKIFKDQGAKFISHEEAKKEISPNPAVIMPDSTWRGNKALFKTGGKSLELYYFGRNHGNGMTVFRFPEYNAVFIIDLVVPDRVLYAYLPDASPKDWVEDLKKIQALPFNTVYMAHERAIGNRNDVTLVQNYFDALYAAVEKELSSNTPFFEIPQRVKLPQYQHLKNYDEWLHMNVWRILMEKSIGK
ncbi:MBL fold metallo-hydrolase [Cesiribacter sp. SM1]|uniref:MBL fold metallo-hydrolase n=1 Tax=Cesiribacter sp. SM1 TaxID=2861196 RepID=UPI001CD4E993|nr:MBL fold metallo-hydrolase [Cesiribacter sp. SM1]